MHETSNEALWRESEAAGYLQQQPRTLQSWRQKGVGPSFLRLSGRSVRYRKSDIDSWLSERLKSSTSED